MILEELPHIADGHYALKIYFMMLSIVVGSLLSEGINGGMLFVENIGQVKNEIAFYSIHPSGIYIWRDGSIYINGIILKIGKTPSSIEGIYQERFSISYFKPNKVVKDVPSFKGVILKDIYEGIDAILLSNGKDLEMQFHISEGRDPSIIKITTTGRVQHTEDGIYVLTSNRKIKVSDIRAYQGSREIPIEPLIDGNTISFKVEGYDPKYPLVIDPIYKTVYGGSGEDVGRDIAVDAYGNIYIVGYTASTDYPTDTSIGSTGNIDVFISKFDANMNHIKDVIIGGSGEDKGFAIDIEGGYVYITGYTLSSDFPSNNQYGDPGNKEIFVSKLDTALGTHSAVLIESQLDEEGRDIVAGDYVSITGYSDDALGIGGRIDRDQFGTCNNEDVVVIMLNPTDLSINRLAAICGSGTDVGNALDIEPSSSDYAYFITGYTTDANSFSSSRTTYGNLGSKDIFLSHLIFRTQSGIFEHQWTSVIGGSSDDVGTGVDDSLLINIYVAGYTSSSDYPSGDVFGTRGGTDVVINKFSAVDGDTIGNSVFIAGSSEDTATSIKVFRDTVVYVSGYTNSSDFVGDNDTVIAGPRGGNDMFFSKLPAELSNMDSTVIFAGSDEDKAYNFIVSSEKIYLAGFTSSSDFVSSNSIMVGGGDLAITKFNYDLTPVNSKEIEQNLVIARDGKIIFQVSESAYIGMDIYDNTGRALSKVSIGYVPAGRYEYPLILPRGVYLIKVRIGGRVETVKYLNY